MNKDELIEQINECDNFIDAAKLMTDTKLESTYKKRKTILLRKLKEFENDVDD